MSYPARRAETRTTAMAAAIRSLRIVASDLASGRPLCGLLLSSSELQFYNDPLVRWKRDRAGDFFWRRGKALGRPSIRAGAPWHRSPHPVFARRRLRSAVAEAPSNGRFAVRTRRHNGLSAPTRFPFRYEAVCPSIGREVPASRQRLPERLPSPGTARVQSRVCARAPRCRSAGVDCCRDRSAPDTSA